jgi:hypothetical protein
MEEMYKKCDLCEGNGWTAEHSPNCNPHEPCARGQCPIQEPCQKCNATGYVPCPPQLREVRTELINCIEYILEMGIGELLKTYDKESVVDEYLASK